MCVHVADAVARFIEHHAANAVRVCVCVRILCNYTAGSVASSLTPTEFTPRKFPPSVWCVPWCAVCSLLLEHAAATTTTMRKRGESERQAGAEKAWLLISSEPVFPRALKRKQSARARHIRHPFAPPLRHHCVRASSYDGNDAVCVRACLCCECAGSSLPSESFLGKFAVPGGGRDICYERV